jgi:hypothetical protein
MSDNDGLSMTRPTAFSKSDENHDSAVAMEVKVDDSFGMGVAQASDESRSLGGKYRCLPQRFTGTTTNVIFVVEVAIVPTRAYNDEQDCALSVEL